MDRFIRMVRLSTMKKLSKIWRDKGVIVLRSEEDLDMISQGTVIIHVLTEWKNAFMKSSNKKVIRIVDATCPFVKKIHNIVSEKERSRDFILL